jgi:nitrilase
MSNHRVAAIQATPVFLDREGSTEKACRLIAEAGAGGARLAVFPEGFIPTYPVWVWFIPAGKTADLRDLYSELLANAVTVPDETTHRLCQAARDARVSVAIGVNERNSEASGATLLNTLLIIDEAGEIRGRHRKLVPTAGERLVHGRGDGSTLQVHDLPVGKTGGLICWENYMPLARYALYAMGMQIHVAPTWDRGEPWISTMRHVAKEGRSYVIGCCSPVSREDIPDRYPFKETYLPDGMEWLNTGGSLIVDPDGKILAGPAEKTEEILYTDIDPERFRGPRFQLDVAGHYARPDVFTLTVHREPQPMMKRAGAGDEPTPAVDRPFRKTRSESGD